jgi:hypothetical protein
MGIERLSPSDIQVVRECLSAAVHGPFIPDWEFRTLIGLTSDEVDAVLAAWPAATEGEAQDIAVNNVLNNLLGYPHGLWAQWSDYVSVEPAEVASVLARWRDESSHDDTPGGYFDRLR